MMQEYQTMRLVQRNPRIGKAFALFQDSDFFHIEMEFHEGGDFTKVKQRAIGAGVSLTEVWWGSLLKQCLEALSHVHALGIVHCDVKEPNLMLKTANYHEPSVVLIDFGIAQKEGTKHSITYGTPGYIPPEVWQSHVWYTAGDLFSLGVTMLQMLIDRTPSIEDPGCGIFVGNAFGLKDIAVATHTQQPPIHLIPPRYHHLKSVISQVLSKDASKRPSARELLLVVEGNTSAAVANSTEDSILSTPEETLGDDKKDDDWSSQVMTAASIGALPFLLLALL
jgi:serine/threonine protein kinase